MGSLCLVIRRISKVGRSHHSGPKSICCPPGTGNPLGQRVNLLSFSVPEEMVFWESSFPTDFKSSG